LRFELPPDARTRAQRRLGTTTENSAAEPWIAVMPAGSSDRSLYPSLSAWRLVLDALVEAFPEVRFALVGKLRRDRRTNTTLAPSEHQELLGHRSAPIDCFDLDLASSRRRRSSRMATTAHGHRA